MPDGEAMVLQLLKRNPLNLKGNLHLDCFSGPIVFVVHLI